MSSRVPGNRIATAHACWQKGDLAGCRKFAALALDADARHLDGYALLAETAPSLWEKSALLRELIRRGGTMFTGLAKEDIADGWLAHEEHGAAYIRAHADLAIVCWELGERREACDLIRTLFELAPLHRHSANKDAVCLALKWFPLVHAWDETRRLLDACERVGIGDMAQVAYASVLCAVHDSVSGDEMRSALKAALDTNQWIAAELVAPSIAVKTDNLRARHGLDMSVETGLSHEAGAVYAEAIRELWQSVPGAIDVLRRFQKSRDMAEAAAGMRISASGRARIPFRGSVR